MKPLAVISGTSKGIGFALSNWLLEEGWIVCACSRNETRIDHPQFHHFILDVSDEIRVFQMIASLCKDFGRIDALLNNAGTASMNHIIITPKESFEHIFQTNVFGPFLLLREVFRLMISRKHGRIINFTSIANPLNQKGVATYALSKVAVESLTQIADKELGYHNITENAIGSTPVQTDLIKKVPKSKMASLLRRQAIKRLGTFEDIKNAVSSFIRPQSHFITSQILYLGDFH